MFILTDKESGGVYAVQTKDRRKTVTMFVEEDDAIRYVDLLMAEDYEDDLEILEVDPDVVVANCQMHGYFYSIVPSDEFVIPPR
ncbi:gp147 [Synechococcus phage syn9]|uniref:Gp147 n=1 Tax=Synechococcus phage syn9 TaxID=382359 RepID=Q0QZ78_BPSYS|nr:gp147 [Synechococcus phage syn9]ABA47118.1 gp147 [Synechococcus phage syn9]AGH56529.1 hypothetical protein CPUG_00036 [Cyanophage Syn10]